MLLLHIHVSKNVGIYFNVHALDYVSIAEHLRCVSSEFKCSGNA